LFILKLAQLLWLSMFLVIEFYIMNYLLLYEILTFHFSQTFHKMFNGFSTSRTQTFIIYI